MSVHEPSACRNYGLDRAPLSGPCRSLVNCCLRCHCRLEVERGGTGGRQWRRSCCRRRWLVAKAAMVANGVVMPSRQSDGIFDGKNGPKGPFIIVYQCFNYISSRPQGSPPSSQNRHYSSFFWRHGENSPHIFLRLRWTALDSAGPLVALFSIRGKPLAVVGLPAKWHGRITVSVLSTAGRLGDGAWLSGAPFYRT